MIRRAVALDLLGLGFFLLVTILGLIFRRVLGMDRSMPAIWWGRRVAESLWSLNGCCCRMIEVGLEGEARCLAEMQAGTSGSA